MVLMLVLIVFDIFVLSFFFYPLEDLRSETLPEARGTLELLRAQDRLKRTTAFRVMTKLRKRITIRQVTTTSM